MLPRGYDKLIHYATLFLAFFGLIMIGSATTGEAARSGIGYTISSMIKQFVFIFGGIVGMITMARIFRVKMTGAWARLSYLLAVAGIFITYLFDPINGTKAWIIFPGGFTLQPSEFSKISVILMMANVVEELRRYNNPEVRDIYAFWRPMGFTAIVVFLVWLQNDTGTAAIIAILGLACYMSASNPLLRIYKRRIALSLIGVGLLVLLIGLPFFLAEYQYSRFLAFLDPLSDQNNTTYQLSSGLQAIASGGIFGKGFGNSTFKHGYIPFAASDFIFTIIIEELGIIGIIIIFGCYFLIINQLMYYAIRMETEKEKIIIFGVATYLFVHLLINVGGVSALIPMTGVPLIFISAGGSSTLAAFIMIGICQAIISNFNRQTRKVQK